MGITHSYSSSTGRLQIPIDHVVESTTNNYQGRYEKFAEWSEKEENCKPAGECRKLLLDAIVKEMNLCGTKPSCEEGVKDVIRILDAGCGSGRDVSHFDGMKVGYCTENYHMHTVEAYGFDPCPGFVQICRDQKGLSRVVQGDFFSYFDDNGKYKRNTNVIKKKFHGIFSLAALFHIPREELESVLHMFWENLTPDANRSDETPGYLLISIPNGDKNRMSDDGRWMNYMRKREQIRILQKAGFDVICLRKICQYNGKDWIVTLSKKNVNRNPKIHK